MLRILIAESNTPDMVARGASDARPFLETLPRLDHAVETRVVEPYEAPLTPDDLDWSHGVVFTGSGVPWCVDDPRAQPLAAAMQAAFDSGLPIWGSCNGMQLAAWLLGGRCGASVNGREDGVATGITLTEAGRAHPMMTGRVSGFSAPAIHRDEVTALPEGATLLAGNAHSPVQAMVWQQGGVDFWGTQYHPECALASIAEMIGDDPARAGLAEDLRNAGSDAAARERLGMGPRPLTFAEQSLELRNWLDHVRARSAGPTQL